ncbi:MAG: sulfite exporter TauE/SafE family protein [Aminivibrio sp.]|jgi:uncharacterized membrane protein YfcA
MEFLTWFTDLDLPVWAWLIVLASGAGIGIAKTAVPGSGILVVALMAMALPSRMSVGVLLPLLIIGDFFALGKFWRYTDRKLLLSLIPFALAGLGAGFFILRYVSDERLKPIIGGVILTLLAVRQISEYYKKREAARGGSPSEKRNPFLMALFGFFSGLGTGMANSSGPILSLYFLILGLPKLPFMATTTWFFFIMNLLKVPLYFSLDLINAQSLKLSLLALPSVAAGALLGFWIVTRIPQRRFNQAVLALAFVAAVRLIL